MDLDEEDIADILADTLQKKYFEKGIVMDKRIEEETSVKLSNAELIAFDYKYEDNDEENDQNHEENMRGFCDSSAEFYCKDELGSFYVESKGQIIFWNPKDQTLLCKDITNSNNKSIKYKTSSPFQFLTVFESGGELLFVVASNDKLIVYSIQEENQGDSEDPRPLELCQEFPLEGKIVFLASDHTNNLFVVTEGPKADIYALKSQNNKLELQKTFSFGAFDLPRKVVFDRVCNLLFILSGDILKIYKYHAVMATSFHIISKIKTKTFIWHQATQRLLLTGLKKLYQFGKGRFRLLRKIAGSNIKPIELTNQGILYTNTNGQEFLLLSLKNPKEQKSFTLPSVKSEMSSLKSESFERFYSCGFASDVDPRTGNLCTTFQAIKVIGETSGHLLIFANIESFQYAAQRVEHDCWRPFGGTIYTQRLLTLFMQKILFHHGKIFRHWSNKMNPSDGH